MLDNIEESDKYYYIVAKTTLPFGDNRLLYKISYSLDGVAGNCFVTEEDYATLVIGNSVKEMPAIQID